MDIDRRQLFSKGLVAGSLGLSAGLLGATPANALSALPSTGLLAENLGVRAGSGALQTRALQRAIHQAAAEKKPLFLPAGRIKTGMLSLPDNCHLIGIADNSELSFQGGTALLTCNHAKTLHLHGLKLSGNHLRLGNELVKFSHVKKVVMTNCTISQASKNGLSLYHCGGTISQCDIGEIRNTGLFCQDSTGLELSNNFVHDCQNNGIQVWRSRSGHDGTMVINNRIQNIKSKNGGDGQNGNGINIYRADNVMVNNNHISHCTFSAVRNNSSNNCQIVSNHCTHMKEVALFVEFSFEGAVVSNNLIDHAGAGISVTNFNEGGRLATVSGNLIRNITGIPQEKWYGMGIAVEADTIVSGNVIENIKDDAIDIGWGKYVRDIVVTSNLIRQCKVGIGITAVSGGGYLTVNNNMISKTKKGAIFAKDHDRYIGMDLSKKGAKSYPNFEIFANIARK